MLLEKYNINISKKSVNKNSTRLTNQLWKLIPMRENNEDYIKQLETVIIEVAGLCEIFSNSALLQLLSKLEGLRVQETTFELYRKTVFECISLIQELNYGR